MASVRHKTVPGFHPFWKNYVCDLQKLPPGRKDVVLDKQKGLDQQSLANGFRYPDGMPTTEKNCRYE